MSKKHENKPETPGLRCASSELAEDDRHNKNNQNSNDSNSNHPICSHPRVNVSVPGAPTQKYFSRGSLPTSHPPQRLDASVDIALTLHKAVVRMLDRLALSVEVGQGTGADGFRLVR